MKAPRTFIVVENAGYVGENDRQGGFATYSEANDWMRTQYPDEDERERLHVDIAAENVNGDRTYDF